MKFTCAYIAHTPDADPAVHRSVVETEITKLFTILVKTQEQAVAESKKLAAEEGIQSMVLCPGFTNADVAELQAAVGKNVAISVARGDGPGNRIIMETFQKVGWFG